MVGGRARFQNQAKEYKTATEEQKGSFFIKGGGAQTVGALGAGAPGGSLVGNL